MLQSKEVIIRSLVIENGKTTIESDNRILATRSGLAAIKAIAGNDYDFGGIHHVFEKVEVQWDPEKFCPEDFIINHSRHFRRGWPEQEWYLIAGNKPQWFNFSQAWMDWILNPEIQNSAYAHLLRLKRLRAFRLQIATCRQNPDLAIAITTWNAIIQTYFSGEAAKKLDRYLSRCTYSTFVVKAMPIKLAMRMGKWIPPVPRPVPTPLPKNLHVLAITE